MVDREKLMDCLSSPSYDARYRNAKASESCILCGRRVKEFHTLSAKFEYQISALCEPCQRACFSNTNSSHPDS